MESRHPSRRRMAGRIVPSSTNPARHSTAADARWRESPLTAVEHATLANQYLRSSEAPMKAMLEHVRSSLLGALIATVIYMVIATATDASKGNVIGYGLGLGILTFVVSYAISTVITKKRSAQAGGPH